MNKIEIEKKKNLEKIKVGSCIELLCLLDSFFSDFDRLQEFLTTNEDFFNNQRLSTICEQFDNIKRVLTNDVDILLDDIDNAQYYNDFMLRYY